MTDAQPAYRLIDAETAERRFRVSARVVYPFDEFADEQEIRCYDGDLHVSGDFASPSEVDWVPFNTVVDGDLIVAGDIDWHDYGNGNFLLVTGNVRARNVFLQGCPTVAVYGDLSVSGAILGFHGDDGGELLVDGTTTAPLTIATMYFGMTLGDKPDGLVVADADRIDCPVDFDEAEAVRVILPEFLDGDSIEVVELAKALRDGRSVIRQGVKTLHALTVEQLDALVAEGGVTELDLSHRRLTEIPPQVFELTELRRLDLSHNEITVLPVESTRLTKLAHLNLSHNAFETLPDHIGRLDALTTLELEGLGNLTCLPEALGDLTRLRVLNLSMLDCALPDSLAALDGLAELDLSYWRRDAEPYPFPMVLTRLTGLTSLDLTATRFTALPNELARLTLLERLRLDSALTFLPDLEALTGLPRLTRLELNGLTASGNRYPSFDLLAPVWRMSGLTELHADRFGRETAYDPTVDDHVEVRPALTSLPDDLFAGLPRLCRLDLSFIELSSLPESLYRLPELAYLNLEYTHLDRAAVDRLGAELPKVRVDLRNVTTRFDVDDPNWREVHRLVAEGAAALVGDDDHAIGLLESALERCGDTAIFSEYDALYARYGLIGALGRLAQRTEGDRRAEVVERCRHHARAVLESVPEPEAVWHYTDEGAFQEEATRHASNALGWYAMEEGRYDDALSELERGLAVADPSEHGFIYDTRIRVLLHMGDTDAAYTLLDRVLTHDPDFDDLQDLRFDEHYSAWKAES
ncbi:leucine rich repeat (LRR) protein [Stackebrandtia albiflava]|uniref:Leucine rich repeat (LRR) protein n=1 Tax=Stackebrandtia albiflava TaxID=406432 RepID=A0A562VDX8_9ACTN|nr:leucine-rich repeat domain-containing protein [Stackebrandtia albiflava]TWJ16089.1 leucine rich repeat (LRR) protein [Stackebrandtia albiflava]